jgi:hypothetical protein
MNNITLAQGIEQLMQNLTVSLFSGPQFILQNPTNVSVEILQSKLMYNYQSQNLVIGYSLGAAFTLLAICFGIWSIVWNESVYSDSISAIIRVLRNPQLDALIGPEDTDGSSPAPKYLKEAKIQLHSFMERDFYSQRSAFVIIPT